MHNSFPLEKNDKELLIVNKKILICFSAKLERDWRRVLCNRHTPIHPHTRLRAIACCLERRIYDLYVEYICLPALYLFEKLNPVLRIADLLSDDLSGIVNHCSVSTSDKGNWALGFLDIVAYQCI